MSFETVVFVVSYLIQAIRLYAWSYCLRLLCLWCHLIQVIECLCAHSCRLRLLCLWCYISFRRLSIYTHSHVVWDLVFVVSYLIQVIEHLFVAGHIVWDCCICGVTSFRWWGILYETVVLMVSYLILAIVLQQVILFEMLYFVIHFECHNNL